MTTPSRKAWRVTIAGLMLLVALCALACYLSRPRPAFTHPIGVYW